MACLPAHGYGTWVKASPVGWLPGLQCMQCMHAYLYTYTIK